MGNSNMSEKYVKIQLLIGLLVSYLLFAYAYYYFVNIIYPNVEVTESIEIFQNEQKEKTWKTTHSLKRIDKNIELDLNIPTFSNEDGYLHAYKYWNTIDAPFSAAYTLNSYSKYVLELEYKWGDKKFNPRVEKPRDAGIIFHIYGFRNEPWPSGLEYQLLQPNQSGSLVTVRTRARIKKIDKGQLLDAEENILIGKNKGASHTTIYNSTEKPEWNTVRLEINGDTGVFYHNGINTIEFYKAEYFNPMIRRWSPLTKGRILLQAEGAEIQYRNIKIRPL